MACQVLQELSKEQIVVTKSEEAILAWHENYISVLSEKGVHIFELTHNIKCLDKKIDCNQALICHPKYSPAANLFTSRVLNKTLRNVDLTEMIVDHSLWPHNLQLLQEMSVIVYYRWSSAGALKYYGSAIAVLTNVGVVEIHMKRLLKWQCTLRISDMLSLECSNLLNLPESFEEARDAAHMLATSAMCWSPNEQDNCYLVTAQKNGNIVFWLLECNQSNCTAKIIGTEQSESSEIQSMLWIPLTTNRFLLVCSNILGEIIASKCHIFKDRIKITQTFTLWSYKDKMVPMFLEYVEVESNITLYCNKNRHLLVMLFDKEGTILAQYVNNINDYRITCINKANNEIHVTTINCKIYKLNLAVESNHLNITLDPIQTNTYSISHELYGMVFSHNMIMSALCITDRKVNCRKDPLKLEVIVTSTREKLESAANMLSTNPTKLLTSYWDVIEALRYKCMKAKEVPNVNLQLLYERAATNIYLLKIYYIFCTIVDNLKRTFKIGPSIVLPQNKPDAVKEEILILHADKLILKYTKKFKEQGKLMPLEMEFFAGAKKILEYFLSNDKKISKELLNIDPSIMNILDASTPFICQCCNEEVTGFKCKFNHLNMFCALTFTPIETDNYLFCKCCNLTARIELLTESPLCLFCDLPLICVDEIC